MGVVMNGVSHGLGQSAHAATEAGLISEGKVS